MLRRVVVENYVIFKGRHELDFDGRNSCNFYTFVGENATGKSSLVALIKAASNLQEEGPDFEVIANGKEESKVVCQFEFKNGADLVKLCKDCCSAASCQQSVTSGLTSWFSDEILKIPTPLFEQIRTTCGRIHSRLQVLVGHRHQPMHNARTAKEVDVDRLCNSQFLYILMEEGIFVATKSGGTLTTGFHEPLPGGVNPVDWVPQRSFLLNVTEVPYVAEFIPELDITLSSSSGISLDSSCQSSTVAKTTSEQPSGVTKMSPLGPSGDESSEVSMETSAKPEDGMKTAYPQSGDIAMEIGIYSSQTGVHSDDVTRPALATTLLSRPPFRRLSSFGGLAWSSYHELKKIIVAELLDGFSEENLHDIHPLFHEIIGDKSITFELKIPDQPLQVMDNRTNRVMRRIPEGLFSAFIIAALLVKPNTRNVILDEPTRGMHPLQSRRLRKILMRESARRHKCIIATTHSPELLDVDRITQIWRFQLLPNGYCQARRVTARYSERELLFIGGAEVREIFFSRHIIWVEGESDKRFIEELLSLFDEGRTDLFRALLEHDSKSLMSHAERSRSPQSLPSPRSTEAYIRTLLTNPAYQRKYFSAEELSLVQEAVRSCKVLSVGGKNNIWKGAAICRDLRIPYAVICDLDAIIPNSRENSIQSQFERCAGDWFAATIPHAKTKLLDEEESPACKAIDETDHAQLARLKSCRVVGEVMRFYEEQHYIFTWWPMGGEIEDAVRLTKAQFGKKLWPDMLSEELKVLILSLIDPRKLLLKNPKDREASKEPNLEILRCIYFIIKFFKETLEN